MDEDRRKFDADFKFKIIEQQARLEALLIHANKLSDEIKNIQAAHGQKIASLEHALWGGPGIENIGLIEQNRKLAKNWSIIISVCVFIFSAAGKYLSPLVGKWVTDYVYNSPSEKWRVEQRRPRVRRYTVKVVRPKPTSKVETDTDTLESTP